MSKPFKYNLGDTGLQVKIAGKTIREIPYSDIDRVNSGYAFFNEHWTNISPMKFVTIHRKTGIMKKFVINPPDRKSFIETLNSKIDQTQSAEHEHE